MFRPIIYFFLLSVSVSVSVSVLANSNSVSDFLFEIYPERGVCTLKDGSKIPFPFHVYDARQLTLMGIVDLDKVGNLVPKESGFKPLAFGFKGLTKKYGLLMIQSIDYKKTNTIPYHETLFSLLVSKSPFETNLDINEVAKRPWSFRDLGVFYMFKLYLNELLPTTAGLELGGFNKELARVEYDFDLNQKRVEVATQGEGAILRLEAKNISEISFPMVADFKALTSASYEARSVMVGHASMTPFSKNDELFLSLENKWTKKVRDMNFKPLLWQYDPSFKMVVLQVLESDIPSICKKNF